MLECQLLTDQATRTAVVPLLGALPAFCLCCISQLTAYDHLTCLSGKQTGRLKSVMMELRKCCNHPFLISEQEWPTTRDPDQFLQQLVQASGKLALLDSMLARMKDRGHRVLIYSQFTTLLDLLEDWLTAHKWGYQRIDGSVGGPERQSRIDQFNKRPADNFVFLLSTKAGGLGINLASADTVIIYDSDWNPHNDLQAQARAHRLGQLKPVMIYRSPFPPHVPCIFGACAVEQFCFLAALLAGLLLLDYLVMRHVDVYLWALLASVVCTHTHTHIHTLPTGSFPKSKVAKVLLPMSEPTAAHA